MDVRMAGGGSTEIPMVTKITEFVLNKINYIAKHFVKINVNKGKEWPCVSGRGWVFL
jgi:hypothetical protein